MSGNGNGMIPSLGELRIELSRLSGIDFTSLNAVRAELERRGGDTATPGIRGDARRETLEVRLKNLLEKQGVPLYVQAKPSSATAAAMGEPFAARIHGSAEHPGQLI